MFLAGKQAQYMHMYVHVCTCMYMYVHVCTCMYMYVHVCTCMHVSHTSSRLILFRLFQFKPTEVGPLVAWCFQIYNAQVMSSSNHVASLSFRRSSPSIRHPSPVTVGGLLFVPSANTSEEKWLGQKPGPHLK